MHGAHAVVLTLVGIGCIAAYAAFPGTNVPRIVASSDRAPVFAVSIPVPSGLQPRPSDEIPAVVSAVHGARPPGEQPQGAVPAPADRAALTRELQRELKRVGCYEGQINGIWTTSSRMAMQTFTERVNAALPIDEPDSVLLSLVQAYSGVACGKSCPAGQDMVLSGHCLPTALIAAKLRSQDLSPATVLRDRERAAQEKRLQVARASAEQNTNDGQPLQSRPAVRLCPSKPPKFVRSVLKGFQRTLAQSGLW
jgi:hypothetical protein